MAVVVAQQMSVHTSAQAVSPKVPKSKREAKQLLQPRRLTIDKLVFVFTKFSCAWRAAAAPHGHGPPDRQTTREPGFKAVCLYNTTIPPTALLFKHLKLPNHTTSFTDSALHYIHMPNQTYIKCSSQCMSTLNNSPQEKKAFTL